MSPDNEYETAEQQKIDQTALLPRATAAEEPNGATTDRTERGQGVAGPGAVNRLPLLDQITRQSMDEDYAMVAARRRAVGAQKAKGPVWRSSGFVVVLAASALLATVALVQVSSNAEVTALGRAGLVERINLTRENIRTLQDEAGELSAVNATLEERTRALREREDDVTGRVRRLGARTGSLAVSGPGVRVVVDDAPEGGLDQTVRDSDLILLVDGLWAAGAEAVAINGQRLTVLTPIQNSGQAIHVNVRPLAPPYMVEAIGDPETLEGNLLASTSGSTFYGVADALGFEVEVEDVEKLNLPATRVRSLRHAEVLQDKDAENSEKGDGQ